MPTKIKIEKLKFPWYAPREEYDEEYLKELSESLGSLGLLDDIIVRRNTNGDYELIAGGQRVRAAKLLGWTEIDAKVLDVTEEDAAVLALESNVVRRNLKLELILAYTFLINQIHRLFIEIRQSISNVANKGRA